MNRIERIFSCADDIEIPDDDPLERLEAEGIKRDRISEKLADEIWNELKRDAAVRGVRQINGHWKQRQNLGEKKSKTTLIGMRLQSDLWF